ncbi:hypothetical protein K6Y31_19290 [Motilimonas cestriensis]|uniref:PQQ-binding-like beta-propeller repeat protein n=1 Tax=Motilimonas cestriensis TaxID=2742685 RepID=A0ABS8WED4_9GAMM|nr:hypothetical protein [Motilimonas cestriensis]MCE2596923.1 hypothetical protein [Motilimonas cestriensis]
MKKMIACYMGEINSERYSDFFAMYNAATFDFIDSYNSEQGKRVGNVDKNLINIKLDNERYLTWFNRIENKSDSFQLPENVVGQIVVSTKYIIFSYQEDTERFFVYNLASREKVAEIKCGNVFFSFANEQFCIAERDDDKSLMKIDLLTGTVLWQADVGNFTFRTFSEKSNCIITERNKSWIALDVNTGKEVTRLELTDTLGPDFFSNYIHTFSEAGHHWLWNIDTLELVEFDVAAYSSSYRYQHLLFDNATKLLVFEELEKGCNGWVYLYEVPSGKALGKARLLDQSLAFTHSWTCLNGRIYCRARTHAEFSARLLSFALSELDGTALTVTEEEQNVVQTHHHLLKSSYDIQLSFPLPARFDTALRHLTERLWAILDAWHEKQERREDRRFSNKLTLNLSGLELNDEQRSIFDKMITYFVACFKVRDAPEYQPEKQLYTFKLKRGGNRWS